MITVAVAGGVGNEEFCFGRPEIKLHNDSGSDIYQKLILAHIVNEVCSRHNKKETFLSINM